MKTQTKRVIAIHDLSTFGRCSLSVVLPIISSMGIQVIAVPTALLSTHFGGLGEPAMRDLTDFLAPCLAHYKKMELKIDGVYSGFLASEEQIGLCKSFFAEYSGALKVVDPVMGDHGKPYKICTPQLQDRMKELVSLADIITPNLTETAILLSEPYSGGPLTASQLRSMLARLSRLGPEKVVITGVPTVDGGMMNAGYDRVRSCYWRVLCDYVPVSYPGTGDIFASVLTASMMGGDSLPLAMERATKFCELAIKTTYSFGTDSRYGVMFESCLSALKGEPSGNFEAL